MSKGRNPKGQHFLISAAARSLSLAKVLRMSGSVEDTGKK